MRRGSRATAALALGLLLVPWGFVAGGEHTDVDALLTMARRAAPGIVRVQWRPYRGADAPIERHAVVVDTDGWLLMAGPPVSEHGTLAASFSDGRAARARVWATDAGSALTLLHVPLSGLVPIPFRGVTQDDGEEVPDRFPPGETVFMVTAEGALARGARRANHRAFRLLDPLDGEGHEVTGLDEASLSVVTTDLGAPWLDEEGRLVGLLLGADVEVPDAAHPPDENIRLRPSVVAAYAVPSAVAAIEWPLLRDQRAVDRAALGVHTRPLDLALTHHVCPDCRGWIVAEVLPDGPAARAGIEANDILRGLAGRPLAPGARLADALLPYRPGTEIRVDVLRGGETKVVEVVLGSVR